MPIRRLPLLTLLALLLAACKPPEQPAVISIVGAVLIDGTGGPPISGSVVTIESGRIRATGARTGLLVPAEAEKIDGSGRFLVPGLVEVSSRDVLVLGPASPAAQFEQARRDHRPVIADIFSLADAKTMLDRGATGFLHMIRDTQALDPAFVHRLRDLQVVFVPMLAGEKDPAALAIARGNTKRLADAGVPMAVGTGGEPYREMEMLVEAGLSPGDVLVAATRNGARLLGKLDQEGTIEPGKRANLMLLSANPAEDIRNLTRVARAMRDGVWQAPK